MGVRVNGLNYFVKTVLVDLPSELIGETNFDQCEINIRADLASEKIKQTFWHEVAHILVEGEESGKKSADEKFVTRLANLLYAMLEDNHLLKEDWWTRILDEEPDWGSQIVGAPRLAAARGRKNITNCTARKR